MKMKTLISKLITGLGIALCCLSTAHAQFAPTGTTTVSVTIAAEASLQVDTATTTLTSSGIFANYTGSTALTYKIRTSASTGSGNITLRVTTDFSPAGGPSVLTPPNGGDTLAYTCTVAAPGTACTGSQTSSTTASTPLATFGAAANSATAGNSSSVAWTLVNDPAYKTGAYSATVTFTVSAT